MVGMAGQHQGDPVSLDQALRQQGVGEPVDALVEFADRPVPILEATVDMRRIARGPPVPKLANRYDICLHIVSCGPPRLEAAFTNYCQSIFMIVY